MSTQHTPGPWKFIPEDDTAASLVESDGTSILIMYALENSTGAAHFAANTQLICAAPDMLDALKAVAPELRGLALISETCASMIKQVDAAIAKATGEQA